MEETLDSELARRLKLGIGKKEDLADSSDLEMLPMGVRMDEAAIMAPSGKFEALYTQNAATCGILILIARDKESGRISAIALSHVGPTIYKKSIAKVFALLRNGGGARIEAYVIGGSAYNSKNILDAAMEEKDTGVKFAWPNASGNREDAAAVDSNGKVYYGELSNFPQGAYLTDFYALVRGGGRLSIKDLRIPDAQNRKSMERAMKNVHTKVLPLKMPVLKQTNASNG